LSLLRKASHFEEEQRIKDNQRQSILEGMGLNFLRFSEQQVRKDMDIVLKAIENYISLQKLTSTPMGNKLYSPSY